VPQPPNGIRHHHCVLALIEFDGKNWSVVEDCRRLFQPLAEQAIHITSVRTINPDATLLNDSAIPANIFANGIKVKLDGTVDASTISQPTCFVTLDLPLSQPGVTVVEWGRGPAAGFVPFILAGRLETMTNEIRWGPSMNPEPWLDTLLSGLATDEQRILAHLKLKGSFIWQTNNVNVYLDGEGYGRPRRNSEDIGLPSGDGRRGGTFEMWFWIVRPLDVSLTLDPEAVPVGTPSKGTVTLTRQAPPGGLTVPLSSSNATIAQVPDSIPVPEGDAGATFEVTTSGVGDTTIRASLAGPVQAAPLRVIGIVSLSLDPNPVNVGSSSSATVTLTGAAPKGGLTVTISGTDRAKLDRTIVVVLENSNTADFTVTVPDLPNEPGSATVTATVGTSTRQVTLTIQAVG
jgi:hypothetical protein